MTCPLRILLLFCVLTLLGSTGFAFAAADQVGVIFSAPNDTYQRVYQALSTSLRQKGYGAERLRLIPQHPNPDYISWANSARRLEAAGSRVIVTLGAPATRVALKEVGRTPVVFASLHTPWSSPLESIPQVSPRERRQAIGATSVVPLATLVQVFSEIVEPYELVTVFLENDPEMAYQFAEISRATSIYGLRSRSLVLSAAEFASGLRPLEEVRGALYLPVGIYSQEQLDALFAKAESLGVPVISSGSGSSVHGALVSLEASSENQGEQAALAIIKLLEGARVETLASHDARNIELVINLEAAHRLGITVPFQALTAATKVIR